MNEEMLNEEISFNPLISILLPVYNATPFLEACLSSVLEQSEKEWELIAVDDFSTDDSFSILEAYGQKDNRIKVLRNREKGIIPALRLAFQNSRGGLITRMDADDIMAPEKLKVLKDLLLLNGLGHVSTGLVSYFTEEGLQVGMGYHKYQCWLNRLTIYGNNYSEIYKECVLPSPCWMIHRRDLESCGAFVPDRYPEDYDLCFRFYKNDIKVVGSKKVLHYWRDHSGRTSRNDPKYSNQLYFDLKLPYFMGTEHDPSRPLVLWGAGKKGKALARKLVDRNIPFHFVCDNPRKIGKTIFETPLFSYRIIRTLECPQVIISVSSPSGKKEILHFLKAYEADIGLDYYFFC